MKKSTLTLGLIAAALLGTGAVTAVAASEAISTADEKYGKVERQVAAWSNSKEGLSTDSEKWRPLNQSVLAPTTGLVTVTFSATVVGAPVEFRLGHPGGILKPGRIRFTPAKGSNSVSFTFVSPSGSACRNIAVQWRSPSGQLARSHSSTLVASYAPEGPKVGCM